MICNRLLVGASHEKLILFSQLSNGDEVCIISRSQLCHNNGKIESIGGSGHSEPDELRKLGTKVGK